MKQACQRSILELEYKIWTRGCGEIQVCFLIKDAMFVGGCLLLTIYIIWAKVIFLCRCFCYNILLKCF